MRRLSCLLPVLWTACAAHSPAPQVASTMPSGALLGSVAAGASTSPATADPVGPAPRAPVGVEACSTDAAAVAATPGTDAEGTVPLAASVTGDDDDLDDGSETPVEEETESVDDASAGDPGLRYSADFDEATLKDAWVNKPELLGSVSIGFAHEGRLMNAVPFPEGEGYRVVSPAKAYATQETVDYVLAAIAKVRAQYPDAPRLRVNNISSKEGGWLRPHKSHQNGRDVDFGFYYPTEDPIRVREREKVIDVKLSWALLEALITETDVQSVLVDKRVIRVLYDHALAIGRDKAWLDSIFHAGASSVVKHAPRHRDHFHVRFYNPRAQELGRRVAPMLALRPEQNVFVHRVRYGDTLGHIALRYGTTIKAIQKANGMKGTFLKLGQRVRVAMRGPCTRCPIPPPVVIPPRRLPPEVSPAVASGPKPAGETTPAPAQVARETPRLSGTGASGGRSAPSLAP